MIALAAGHESHLEGAGASSAIFSALGLSSVQERESSNYAEGRYFLAEANGASFKVSFGDSDEPDLPIWLLVTGTDEVSAEALLDGAIVSLRGAGFRLARLVNFGKVNEQRVDL